MTAKKIKPIHVFIGEETLLMEEALSRLKLRLGENALMNAAAYNAEDGQPAERNDHGNSEHIRRRGSGNKK